MPALSSESAAGRSRVLHLLDTERWGFGEGGRSRVSASPSGPCGSRWHPCRHTGVCDNSRPVPDSPGGRCGCLGVCDNSPTRSRLPRMVLVVLESAITPDPFQTPRDSAAVVFTVSLWTWLQGSTSLFLLFSYSVTLDLGVGWRDVSS